MRLRIWMQSVARRRRRALSAAQRRRRDDLLIPLIVGRLEDRRVLNAAPVLTGANNLTNINANDANNAGTLVSALIAGKATGAGGIAITFADTTSGSWQYTLNGGSTWQNFPTVSQTTALLLTNDSNTSVRFVPGNNFSGSISPALTFQAWDGSTGTAGSTADASTNGGATPFSSASANSSITVVPVITITGTRQTNINDQQTANPFGNAVVSDPAATGESLTVTVSQNDTTTGTLSNLGGFTEIGTSGVYTFTGAAAQATTALQGLLFTPTLHQVTPGTSVSTTFSLSVADIFNTINGQNSVVQVTDTNTAPTLNGANNLPAIHENPVTNNGVTIGALIAGQVTDPDTGQTIGIAVTGVNNTNGDWQYSTDNGTTWTDIGSPTDSAALLLANDRLTRVRFVPNLNFSGLVTPGITFRAWDGFTGTAGATADTTTNGGSTAFSSAELSATILVNDAPVLSGANNLNPIVKNSNGGNGTLVSDLLLNQASDVNGNALGIAITSFDDTNGTWQYSLSGTGGPWTDISGVSATNALLLPGTAAVRFVPAHGFVGTVSMGLTFQAWDGTSGTAGGTADASVDGGTTAFSTASASSSITVGPIITITGTGQTNIDDQQTANPFGNAAVNDPDAPNERLTVTLTQSDTTNGTLSNLGGFVETGSTGVYTFTGKAAQVTAALQGLLFTPTLHQVTPGTFISTTFSLRVADSVSTINDQNTVVQVTATNTAPTLNGANNLPAIHENPATNNGVTIGALIAGQVTDPDTGQTIGIAVTGVNNTNGDWQYSIDNGTIWTDIGSPTDSAALLLANDGMTRVRFAPNLNFSGLVTPGITFRAWDGFTGTAGSTADTTTNGGSTAFSSAELSATILVNDAPVLNGANNLNPIPENNTSNSGALVSDLLSGQASDVNGNALGIAITSVDDTHGTWQYSLSGTGGPWTDIAGVSASTALLLPGTAAVRFIPATGFFGGVSMGLTFQAWDGTSGTAGGTADATVNGGTTAFSTASASSGITVIAPPTIAGVVPNQTTDDHTPVQPFSTVVIGDPNTPAQSMQVTVSIGTPADGQFSSASLVGWTTIVAGTTYEFDGTAAAATTAIETLQFVPTIHQVAPGSSVTTTFTIVASNAVAGPVTNNSTSLKITALNDAPLLDPTLVQPMTTIDETANPIIISGNLNNGNLVSSILAGSVTDPDVGAVQGIAITGTNITGFGLGKFQYSLDGGTTWQDVGTVSAGSALLLRATDLIRFLPDTLNGNVASITFLAWDQTGLTAGKQGTKVTTTPNGGSTPFSLSTAPGTSSITVNHHNHPPTMPSQTILLPTALPAGSAALLLAARDTNLPAETLTYSIASGNANGAFGVAPINTRTADLTVADPAALVYSPTPTVLTVVATNNGTNPGPLSSLQTNTTTIELWQVTTSATLIGADSSTTLTVNLQFPIANQSFQLAVNWGDGQTFAETINPGVNTFTHFYVSNPNTANPAASIPISVEVTDSQSHVDSAPTAAPVPGTGLPGILVVPETAPPPLVVAAAPLLVGPPSTATIEAAVAEPNDVGVATGEVTTSNERQVVLRIVNALGTEGSNILMPDRALDDLPDLFKRLPDGRYRVYLLEGAHERLVIDVVVRQGRPVDPSQESSGTLDRPPTSQSAPTGALHVAAAPHPGDHPRPIEQPAAAADSAADSSNLPATDLPTANSPAAEQVLPRTNGALESLPAAPAPDPQRGGMEPSGSSPPLETPSAGISRPGRRTLWTVAGAGLAAAVVGDAAAERVDETMSRMSRRSLTKAARLARRIRRAGAKP